MGTPTKEGFYWGLWHTPEHGTEDDGEGCDSSEWEVHHVINSPNWGGLSALVPGISQEQSLDNFEWGQEVRRNVH